MNLSEKLRNMKLYLVVFLAVVAFLANSVTADQSDEHVEESTKSPIAEDEIKTSTDRPATSTATDMSEYSSEEPQSQENAVTNFIIQPLIALKARESEDDTTIGKQAASSSPWTIFGFNPTQSLGSLAGSFSGWITDRIPGFVDTPVHEAITTITPRPEVLAHPTDSPNRRRPNRLDYYEDEEDYDDDDFEYEGDDEGEKLIYSAHNRVRPNFGGTNNFRKDDDEQIYEEYEDEDNEFVPEKVQHPNNRLRPGQNNQNLADQQNRRRVTLQRQHMFAKKRPLQQVNQFQYDDDDREGNFFYVGYPSMKRSHNEMGFFQHSQQNVLNQFHQLRNGQASHKPQQTANKRRKQATTLSNRRNGQPVSAEVANKGGNKFTVFNSQLVVPQQVAKKKRLHPNMYQKAKPQQKPQTKPQPQPQSEALSAQLPAKQNNRPPQYIAIPWSQLSLAPAKVVHSFGLQAFGVDSQLKPIILNIPQSAIDQLQKANKKKRPLTPAELQVLPLLSDASLMTILKPARKQPLRTNVITTKKPKVVATTKRSAIQNKPVASPMIKAPPQRVRQGAILEMVPADDNTSDKKSDIESLESAPNSEESDGSKLRKGNNRVQNSEMEYIVIGDDDEPGLVRQVQPVYGNERLLQGGISPYFEILGREQKVGRAIQETVEDGVKHEEIPVDIVYEASGVSESTRHTTEEH